MEEKNITMADLMVKIIQDGQMEPAEEDMIWKLLWERKQERDAKRSCRCLSEYVEREMELLVTEQKKMNDEKCTRINKMCFRESRIASIDIGEFSETDIRKLIILTAESRRLNNEDSVLFMLMLQHTLNELGEKGVLSFNPSRKIFNEYKAARDRITFIDNPYTVGEVQKIREWIDANPYDMRGLAAGMWIEAEITAEEIVGLRKESMMDSDGINTANPTVIKKNETEDYITVAGRRGKIVSDALDLHAGRGLEYIFMSDDKGEWKKMSARCLPLKMSFICRDIGIKYKPFKCTDAIKWCCDG